MKLELLNKDTFPVLNGLSTQRLKIMPDGKIYFSASLLNRIMAGKKQKEYISIAEDADKPTDWYVVHEENEDGYKLGKTNGFTHVALVAEIIKSLALSPDHVHSFELDKPFLYEGCMCYKILNNTLVSTPVRKFKQK